MEEKVLVNQIKALIEKETNKNLKAENDKLKKEIQELKNTLIKVNQLSKVDLCHLSPNCLDCKKQTDNYKLIDLGLPSGTLWMDRNVGAKSPTNSGLYFAWGETTGYTADEVGKTKIFSWTDYKHCKGTYNTPTKYFNNSNHGQYKYTNSLVTLQTVDDAAYQFTNGKCQMPTEAQIQELLDNTTYEWTTQDGVKGGLFTSKTNDNSIFVPATGGCANGFVNCVGNSSHLWSSSLYEDFNDDACGLYFGDRVVICDCYYRHYGFTVRGVAKS